MQEMIQGGSFDGDGGAWNYGLEVRAGQRYMVELRVKADGPAGGLSLYTYQPDHGMRVIDSFSHDYGSGVARLIFTAEQDGVQQLGTRGWGAYGETLDFEIVAREIPADDHADLPAGATPLRVGQTLAGDLDWSGDIDCFSVSLKAGQPYRLKLQGGDPAPLFAGRLQLQGPQGSDGHEVQAYYDAINTDSPDGCDLLFTPAVDGVYTLQVDSPNLAAIGSYSLSLDTRPRDDHGDLPTQASGLVLGHGEQGRIDGQGDADCFSIVAQAGQRIAVSLRPVDAGSGMQLALSMPEAEDGLGGYGASSGLSPQIIFTSPADGPYIVRVEGTAGKGWAGDLYRVDAQVLGADDAPDTSGGAALLAGQPVRGVLDAVADVDRFSAWLQAGQRYRAVLVEDTPASASQPPHPMWLWASSADGLDGHVTTPWQSGDQSLVIQPASNGRYDFTVSGWGDLDRPAAHYQLQLEAIAADDHADTAAQATSLPFEKDVTGQLDTPDDIDYFAFPVKAGELYQLQLHRPAQGGDAESSYQVMPHVELSLNDGSYLPSSSMYTWVDGGQADGFEGAVGDWSLLPGQDGTAIVRISSPQQFAELGYTLHLRLIEDDGQGWLALPGQDQDAGPLHLGGASDLGAFINGTAGNDNLIGTPLDDRLRGGDGDDRLTGGGGRDLLLGGDGIDTAIIPVSQYATILQAPNFGGDWPVTDRDSWHLTLPAEGGSSWGSVLTLQGVERLQFTDANLALDMDGHAGTVARLLTVLYGEGANGYYELAGVGLAFLDAGGSAEGLATAAVADWMFPMAARSEDPFDQWLWICRNTGGEPQQQSALFSRGVDALMHGQPLASLVIEAAESLGVTQQLELLGLPQTGLVYYPVLQAG